MGTTNPRKPPPLCNKKKIVREDQPRRVTPSVFSQEMKQSTEERLSNITEVHPPRILELLDMTTYRKISTLDLDQALFQPYPSQMIFQNFIPGQTYKLPLCLLNNDKVLRQVKVEQQDSQYFHVVGPENAGSKVAPGMSATFTVIFTPQESKDYRHRLVCVTERERFEVPIHAIGPRAILDIEDELHLPVCAVKAATEKFYAVWNIGNSMAKFSLHTQRPFSVTPTNGTLDVGKVMQVTVAFNPMTVGEHREDLRLHYHTGEDVFISLYGSCTELDVCLQPDFLWFNKTYISLASKHIVTLTNTTEVRLRYQWKAWPSEHEEDLSLLRDRLKFQEKDKEEEEQLRHLFESNPTAIHQLPLLSRALQERRSKAANQDHFLALSNSCITVGPVEGEIWPKMTQQFHIFFKPEEAKLYQQTLYCDVTGRELRLPLTIKGEGLGPQLQLSSYLIDMKDVCLDDKTCYKVEVSNTGMIDAPFRLSHPDTTFGHCFSFSPEEAVVPPGACQIVEVTFHSRTLGTFSEDLLLTVTGQNEPLTLTFRGCVTGPTFLFDVVDLEFGDVAFGFPQTKTFTISNISSVPMTFALRFLGNGLGSPSVSSDQQVSDLSRKNWQGHTPKDRPRPVEFTASPAAGTVPAMSDVTIKVTLCSNTVKTYWEALVVDVEGVGMQIRAMPIRARCVVPEIAAEPAVLNFQRCFLNHPYEQKVRLTNPSKLPACYGMLDQEHEESPSLLFSSSAPRGVIPPGSSEELPVSLLVKAVGRQQHTLRIAVFGSLQPPMEVILTCIGQGPVVHVQSSQLDFGRIPVLTDIAKALRLSNQSPIPARFTAHMSHRGSAWCVEPSEGEVQPESQLDLRVVAHLNDTLHFQDQLKVFIQDSQTHSVNLSATGTGTTIITDRPFAPSLDLGTHFSHETCQYSFKLINRGQRVHLIYWKLDGILSSKTHRKDSSPQQSFLPPITSSKQRDFRSRTSSISPSKEKPVFSLSPCRVELFPGCSTDMVLTGFSDTPKVVHERLVCHGKIGSHGSLEQIMSVDITCRFVAPVLSISSKQLNFYIKKDRGTSLLPLYEKLVLKNVSYLSVSMKLSLVEPFFLCEAPGDQSPTTTKSLVVHDKRQAELWVSFNPACYQDRMSHIVDQVLVIDYVGHPQQDVVKLHAEVHYPNLHFSTTTVDFGCVCNGTETSSVITITNCSPLPVSYSWVFLDDQHNNNRETETMERRKKKARKSSAALSLPALSAPVRQRFSTDDRSITQSPVCAGEAFDVLPTYGTLQPGKCQAITFIYYGEENVSREVVAQCNVEDGPVYKVTLRGESSVISYSLDSTHLDFGLLVFHCVGEVVVTLKNTGKIGFKFSITHEEEEEVEARVQGSTGRQTDAQQQEDAEQNENGQKVRPGWPLVLPAMGHVNAGAEQILRLLYLPGIPEVFKKHLQLQVAFLPPQDITLTGMGVFPRISLNLPQNLSEEQYGDVVKQASAAVEANRLREELVKEITAAGEPTTATQAVCTPTYDELLHLEVERLLVKENALAVSGSLLELRELQGPPIKWHRLSKFQLPEYVLDFGFVILGTVVSHTVKITNRGLIPVSFQASCKHLEGTGFTAEFEKVKNLPHDETHTFTVKFDPQGAKLGMGDTNVVLLIQVTGGPVVPVRLSAVVTMPVITVSTETLQFDAVQCGMCQMKTIQLLNNDSVPCYWSMAEEVKPIKKVEKSLSPCERKQVLQEQQSPQVVFEMVPCSGMLLPGERVNVHIKFSPTEGCAYNRQLVVNVAESTQQVVVTAEGQGEEPKLEFSPAILELGPCFPANTETEAEVTIKNPCSFPIEFYSLEFDTEYLKEERILRLMQGYDENNVLLLPPRMPGEGLPQELLDYYNDYRSKSKEEGDFGEDENEKQKLKSKQSHPAEQFLELARERGSVSLGELGEMTPVSRAIARHMGVDMSPEGLAALSRRGIAVIVYGAPLTDKSSTAATVAQFYGAACLSVDAVVTDVLINGTSPVGLRARQLYDSAAALYAQKKAEEAAQGGDTIEPRPAEPHEASHPHSAPASLDTTEVMQKPTEDSCSENGPKFHLKTQNTDIALSLGGDVTSLSSLLPEQLLVDVLAERFQSSDCHRGIVIDGLESVYTQCTSSTLQVVLKAINNRKHIYIVNLSDSYAALKERERAQKEAEEALQKERAEREEQWPQQLDEEEYDALTEEEKECVIQQLTQKLQQQKLREREQKRQQEELQKLKEEGLKKKSKKGGKDNKEISGKKNMEHGKQSGPLNGQRLSPCNTSKESLVDAKEQQPNEVQNSSKLTEEAKTSHAEPPQPTDKEEKEKSSVDELQVKFGNYEKSQAEVEHILQHWDRAQGLLLIPHPSEEADKRSRKINSKTLPPLPSQTDNAPPPDIIPHIVLKVTEENHVGAAELLRCGTLPTLDELLDDWGVGPSGPPIPTPTTFSIVSFPKHREQANVQQTCFTFLKNQDEEKDEEKEKDCQASVEKAVVTTSKSRRDKKGGESQRSRSRPSAKAKSTDLRSPLPASSTSAVAQEHQEILELKRNQSLSTFRWVVPAGGEVVLKIWFYSEKQGTFEQTFNFELVGTQRRYRLVCRGISTYPSISKDYKTIFAFSKTALQMKEGLQKTYIIQPGYFEFGPLLCSKSRDRYKENKYPENTEKLVIHNSSGLPAEVQFRFQNDTQATTYLLDPPAMTLDPGQKQELTVWAYPTKVGQMTDSLVCHIKDNPELVIVNLSCWGVRPELELEHKHFNFEKILLHQTGVESQSVLMRNKTALPVSWRLQGVEELGDCFNVPQDQGTIPPNSSASLTMYFKARRLLDIKKIIRLEVSDVQKILGVVHTENIQVTAECYDIAVDITPGGCVDFGTVRVFEEIGQSLKLKNRGKYPVAYKFSLQRTGLTQPKLQSIFKVSPESGTLMPNEKPTTVHVLCRPTTELLIKEQPLMLCQVIEPSIGNGGKTIAKLDIKVSVQAVYSRYKITPAYDINFGPLIHGCKKTQGFTIENSGVYETSFTISHCSTDTLFKRRLGVSEENPSGRPPGTSAKLSLESVQKDAHIAQNRLTVGVFSVFPCTGNLQPGCQQLVTVECIAEQLGNWNQGLLIHINGRNPSDHPDGIPYRLLAEVCKPGILTDIASIFEEHHLCHTSRQLSSEEFCSAESIFVLNENKFIFNKVLVGRTAQARFKLTNNGKVPCMISLAIRYVGAKMARNMEVFDLPSTTLCIPNQSHAFAAINFTPQTMQFYNAVFEATVEGSSELLSTTGHRMPPTPNAKVLEFEIMGEGTLPSVCVVRPALSEIGESPVLQFRRTLVSRKHTLPLVLCNNGNVTAQVQIDMLDKHGVFTLKAAPGNTCSSIQTTELEDSASLDQQFVHRAILRLDVNQQVELEVSFCSDKPLSVNTKMSLQVEGNHYSNTTLQVTGEAYQEIVSLHNMSRSSQEINEEDDDKGNYEVLNFGDCHVGCSYQESFTMTNHSSSQAVKFEWPPSGPNIAFSPQVGILHAGCSKEVTVTFSSTQPMTLTSKSMKCKICVVEFQQSLDQVADWDDQKKTVQWLSSSKLDSEGLQQPVQNKEITTDPEPVCTVVEGSQWELELRVSGVCDYVKFSCNTDTIHFKDTMLYQSRLHHLSIVNEGNVKVEFSWNVLMDPNSNTDKRDGTSTPQPDSMSVGTGNPELPPFSVEPSIGVIDPGATKRFSVSFSPLEVAQFQGRLHCSIPNLLYGYQAPCILMCGRSLLPQCHFDLEDSDYISGGRRNIKFRTPLDPKTRVLEFNGIGFYAPSTRCFTVLNPTSKPYSFKWISEDRESSQFCCLTPSGTIQPGKKVEMCFEYIAEQVDAVESSWSFVIESLSFSVPFLFVGTSREPQVYLERPYLDFGELLLGHNVQQTVDLVNREEEPFHFSILPSSVVCEDQKSSFVVQPMTGTVAPNDRLPLSVSFTPSLEGYVSVRLVLKVKRKSVSLTLTVKADCFAMNASVQVEKPEGGLKEITPNLQDSLNFGKVGVLEQSIFNFLVSNLARCNLEVTFDLTGPPELLQHLEVKPRNVEMVMVGKQLQSSLFFCPRSTCNLQDVRLIIRVKHGPTFTFVLNGRGLAPTLDFSFTQFNFGKRLLYISGMVPASQTLVISNKGKMDVSIHSQFKNTEYLEMDFQPGVLSPGAVMEVPITFYPREACRYHEELPFILNKCFRKQVDILGQGVEIKLEVEDPRQRKLRLGSLTVGQKVKKQVVLVNRSSLALSFTLMLNTDVPQDLKDLSFSPAGELRLKSNGGLCTIEIQFTPCQHVPPFTAELQADFAGLMHPLLTIQGSCQGVQVLLDQNYLSFGAVAQRCQTRKKIVMMNNGGLGARFHWNTEAFPAEVSITPVEGYIGPGVDIPFEVTFAPLELSNDTRYENLSCFVVGSSSPITLTVTGSCITAQTSKEVVKFACHVRSCHTQTLSVLNPTSQRCTIRPVIEGQQWSAAPFVTFEPNQKNTYDITYRPLSMTAEGKKHLGSVFFSFPDGIGILYSLQGTSDPPKAEDTIVHELPAKSHHSSLLPVHNWLSRQQRFRVLIETVKPEKVDASVSLSGLEFIEVPAEEKRDYKLSFFTYKEGHYNIKVTFRNEATGEYLFYLINFKATSPGVLSTIELVTAVHRATSSSVQVDNPLTASVCLTTECRCPDISSPPQLTVRGQSKGILNFEYQPLREGESTTQLTLFCSDLGYFRYNLFLKALPPIPEKTVHFNTSLGSSHSVLAKFMNYTRVKAEYSCKTDCPDFIVDKSVTAPPGFQAGSEAGVEVCFEPYQLGEVKGILHLSSGTGGEYIFPLHGVCVPPKVQGPFVIKSGGNVMIPFKNVFLQTTAFSYQVDNPSFTVKGVDSMPSKKTQNIQVSFNAPPGSPGPWFGSMTISSQHLEGHTKPSSWVFYLKGFRPESS